MLDQILSPVLVGRRDELSELEAAKQFRRVAGWLDERALPVEPEELELKGFEGMQRAYRLRAAVPRVQ
jgi:hypothetical protein